MSGVFLPFTPNGKATELRAIEVKSRLGLTASAPVDPIAVLTRVPARLIDSRWLQSASPDLAHALFVEHASSWSGIGLGESPHDGAFLILLNPTHAPTRQRATAMEEIVHIVLKHPKSELSLRFDITPVRARSYDANVETEAYSVGAACLLPYPELFHAIRDRRESVDALAHRFGVSQAYVEFRIKTAGLMRMYRSRCA